MIIFTPKELFACCILECKSFSSESEISFTNACFSIVRETTFQMVGFNQVVKWRPDWLGLIKLFC